MSLDTGTVVSAVALSTVVTRPVVADSADVTGGGTHSQEVAVHSHPVLQTDSCSVLRAAVVTSWRVSREREQLDSALTEEQTTH